MDCVFEFMEFLPPPPLPPSVSFNGWNFGPIYYILGLSIRRTFNGCRVYSCARMRYLYIYSLDIHEICYCQPTQQQLVYLFFSARRPV